MLAGRDPEQLDRESRDLVTRFGVRAGVHHFEARSLASHAALIQGCVESGGLDGIVLCHGRMDEQDEAQRDVEKARAMVEVNYLSAISLLEPAAVHLEERGRGWICAISSVAGDRGRRSNYLYGSTKAGLNAYLEGLEARLAPAGVAVVTVKPGFVDTSLTWGRGVPLAASPERVARDVVRAITRRRSVVYTPWYWRWIMATLRLLPRPLFRRLPI
jgi:decaprenylphospho-beta-D-erythro-pentofuranosid-2-ulose 2-reductase